MTGVTLIGVTNEDLERLADLVTVRVLAAVTPLLQPASSGPRYADAPHNPLGSERAFLDAARRGDFPTFRRSRRVTAVWTDVEAWIECRKRARRAPSPAPDAIDPIALLDRAEAKRRKPRNAGAPVARR